MLIIENIFCVSLIQNWREAHMFHFVREVGKICRCSCWEKGSFILISEFNYGQMWNIWLSPLSLSLYSTFKYLVNLNKKQCKVLAIFFILTWTQIWWYLWTTVFVIFFGGQNKKLKNVPEHYCNLDLRLILFSWIINGAQKSKFGATWF